MEMEQIEVSVSLVYRVSSSVGSGEYRDADDYILSIVAEISGYADVSESESGVQESRLGELRFYLIRVGNAVNDRVSLFDVFDSFQETVDASAAVFNVSHDDFLPSVQKRFADACWCDDILLLHYLTIDRAARGQKLGLAVLERAMRDWSAGCSLVVIKPFPLQFESTRDEGERDQRLGLSEFPSTEREAFQKLRTYYGQLGFERIGRSRYYALCPNEGLPTREGLPDCISLSPDVLDTLAATRAP